MKKKIIAIFTTSRAEFGLFVPFLRELQRRKFGFKLFVGGAHLRPDMGLTIEEIKQHPFIISDYFDYQLSLSDPYNLSRSVGIGTTEIARIFHMHEFDYCCVMGDRFELLAIVTNALLFNKPIIHIGGGERTEGAIDEQVRHAVTKLSHIHFTSCREYADNIVRMGEDIRNIHTVGDLSVDNMVRMEEIDKEPLFKELGLDARKPTILLTYHPVTLERVVDGVTQIENIFTALKNYDYQVVITSPNSDADRNTIEMMIERECGSNPRLHSFKSLGIKRYLGLMKYCAFVIGNSSSGIVEVPYFKIPTVNIGERQKGRIRHRSIIDVGYTEAEIIRGIEKAASVQFRSSLKRMAYKFGKGDAAKQMVAILLDTDHDGICRKSLHY